MWDGSAFDGAKIALLAEGDLLVYQRDHKPGIPSPGLWDLPGGGREAGESPFVCVQRETFEEFGLNISERDVVWERVYPSASRPGSRSYFFVAKVKRSTFDQVVFGDEGQSWKVMRAEAFLALPDAVATMQARLNDFMNSAPH